MTFQILKSFKTSDYLPIVVSPQGADWTGVFFCNLTHQGFFFVIDVKKGLSTQRYNNRFSRQTHLWENQWFKNFKPWIIHKNSCSWSHIIWIISEKIYPVAIWTNFHQHYSVNKVPIINLYHLTYQYLIIEQVSNRESQHDQKSGPGSLKLTLVSI